MASLDFWQRVPSPDASTSEWAASWEDGSPRASEGKARLWMLIDALTVLASATLATLYRMHMSPLIGAKDFWHGTLIHGRSMSILVALLCGFIFSLIITSRRLNLYHPTRLSSYLNEQRLSVQACLTSGLILTGTLYMVHAEDISRGIVINTLLMVVVLLSLRRAIYRMILYRRFEMGVGTRNILIVGTGAEARALRSQLQSLRHLGYSFRGFIGAPDHAVTKSNDVIGSFDELFECARRRFVDEIFITSHCQADLLEDLMDEARTRDVNLRVVPDLYNGLIWRAPLEYVGQFPTIPLYRCHAPEISLVMKRGFDIVFSAALLLLISPFLLLIALAVKLSSKGPVIYASDRIGIKARVFRCYKFRTMVQDAEKRRAELLKKNERAGVLFKMADDPRITRVGRFLRKYSLDELPQFFNVLKGDMSVVGPRPPIASEVRQYKLSHLRRLDVMPGITGLWQVQGRQDPSFESYISLDVAYIESWSIWLDFKIIIRTIGVMLAGTGA